MALLSPKQAGEKYGFSTSQIRKLIRQGLLKAKMVGTYYAIDDKDLMNLRRRRKAKIN